MNTASGIEVLEQRLSWLVAGDVQQSWKSLTRTWMRDTLRRAVRMAKESAAQEKALERCWALVRNPSCLETIQRAQTRPGIDCQRLHHNLGGLIASAGAASATVHALNAIEKEAKGPTRVRRWLERAGSVLAGQWIDGRREADPRPRWTWETPEELIREATRQLAEAGLQMATARYWACYWLDDSNAPVMSVPLAINNGGVGEIVELRLEPAEENELIDHYDAALQPADVAFLKTLKEAQQNAETGVVWSIRHRDAAEGHIPSNWDTVFEGGSLGLATQVALRLLKEGRTYDHSCLLIGQIVEGMIVKVEAEDVKLRSANDMGKIRRAGIAPNASIGNLRDYPRLEVRRIRTVEEAVEFVSGLIGQVERVLQGEVSKVVDAASTLVGRRRRHSLRTRDSDARVQSWEDLKRLSVPVRVARGIRPYLSEEEVREMEQRRSMGDYSQQNRLEQERRDLRKEEVQKRLPQEKRRQTVSWETIRKNLSRAVVTGDPGYGKTMLSWLEMEENLEALDRIKNQQESIHEIRFSIWMTATKLAALLNQNPAIDTIIQAVAGMHRLKPDVQQWLREQLESGHGRIILDALDEVPRGDRPKLEKLRELPAGIRILMTSRLAGYNGAPFSVPKENEVEVLAFDDRQTEQAIVKWFNAERAQQQDPDEETERQADQESARVLWDHIQEHWMVREILHCPLLLRLACEAADKLRSEHRKLPRWETRTELYEMVLNRALERFVEKADKSQKQEIIEKRIEELENTNPSDPLIPYLKEKLDEMVPGPSVLGSLLDFAADLSLELWRQDSRRTFWNDTDLRKAADAVIAPYLALQRRPDVLQDLIAADILVPAATQQEGLPPRMYTHRTIGEYLVGRSLAEKLKQRCNAPEWVLVDKKAWDPHWRPVLLFLGGQLAKTLEAFDRYVALIRTPETGPKADDWFHYRLSLAAEVLAELPAGGKDRLREQIDVVTEKLFPLYWEALKNGTEESFPRFKPAWKAVGDLDGALRGGSVITYLINALRDSDERVRSAAVHGLGALGESAARHPDTIRAVLAALREWNVPTFTYAEEEDEDDGQSEKDDDAAAMGDFSYDSDFLNKWPLRLNIAETLGALGERAARHPDTVPALLAALGDSKWYVRRAVMEALGALGEPAVRHPLTIPALLAALQGSDPRMRLAGAEALGALGERAARHPDTIPALLAALRDSKRNVRTAAARALGALGEPAARHLETLPALHAALRDPHSIVRTAAAVTLGALGEPAARHPDTIPALLNALRDSSEYVRTAAAEALGALGEPAARHPDTIPALLNALRDSSGYVRTAAAKALGALGELAAGHPQTIPALLAALQDFKRNVCSAAAKALGALGLSAAHHPDTLPALLTALLVGHERAAIARALGALGEPAARHPGILPALRVFLRDSFDVGAAAAAALGALGKPAARDPDTIPALLNALRDSSEYVRTAAAEALGQLQAKGALVFGGTIKYPLVSESRYAVVRWLEDLSRVDSE